MMSEDSRFGGSSGTQAGHGGQDFGFFAQAAVGAPSQFGGPPDPVTQRFSAPPPQPAPGQLGPPPSPLAPSWPVAAPGPGPQPYPPAPRRGLPVWAIVAICVPGSLIVLAILAAIAIPVFLNLRSTPVMPDSIGGVARSTDANMARSAAQIRDRLSRQNPGSKIDAAGYGTFQSGYLLVSANLRMNPSQEFGALGSTIAPAAFGQTQCATNAASHVSLCVRTGTRGSVELLAPGGSELSQLAADTDQAWAAQPFGN
jgi:hypothetical protein